MACRTRLLDPATGAVRIVAEPDLGTLVGLAGDVLVSYGACPGLPCPIIATDLSSPAATVLADAGSSAVAIATPDGPRLVHERSTRPGSAFARSPSTVRPPSTSARCPTGCGSTRTEAAADAATRVPPGWVLLSPDGRLPGAGPDARTQLRHVPDGTTVQLEEVAR